MAHMELRLILTKLVYAYDLELINQDLDWDRDGRVWFLWWKPTLNARIKKRTGLKWGSNGLPL